jgi:hypothetical protein
LVRSTGYGKHLRNRQTSNFGSGTERLQIGVTEDNKLVGVCFKKSGLRLAENPFTEIFEVVAPARKSYIV